MENLFSIVNTPVLYKCHSFTSMVIWDKSLEGIGRGCSILASEVQGTLTMAHPGHNVTNSHVFKDIVSHQNCWVSIKTIEDDKANKNSVTTLSQKDRGKRGWTSNQQGPPQEQQRHQEPQPLTCTPRTTEGSPAPVVASVEFSTSSSLWPLQDRASGLMFLLPGET